MLQASEIPLCGIASHTCLPTGQGMTDEASSIDKGFQHTL